jgi:transketolase
MPSWEVFEEQPEGYKDEVLPPSVTSRISVEAGASTGWHKYVGREGAIVAIDHFGASAPGDVVMREFGFTPEAVAKQAMAVVTTQKRIGK